MVVVVVVVACCCCIPRQLALVLVLTFTPCAGVVFLPSTGANTPLAHMMVSTCCNLLLMNMVPSTSSVHNGSFVCYPSHPTALADTTSWSQVDPASPPQLATGTHFSSGVTKGAWREHTDMSNRKFIQCS